jgi:hypothetical protein
VATANRPRPTERDGCTDRHPRSARPVAGRHAFSLGAEEDCIWDFDLVGAEVEAHLYPWSRKGDVNAWLASNVFNLKEPVSVQAEQALGLARAFLLTAAKASNSLTSEQKTQLQAIDDQLRASLGELDPFWIRWSQFREQVEGRT